MTNIKIDDALKKTRRINIPVTQTLYDSLHAEATLKHVSVPEYVRNLISSRNVKLVHEVALDSTVVIEATRELSRIGNNLNQIARWYNTWGEQNAEKEDELRKLLVSIYEIAERMDAMTKGGKHGHR
jgi:hypothetical protein